MKYQLHDAPPDLWSWVKARAYMERLTINQYIIGLLTIAKDQQEQGHSIAHIIDAIKPSLYNL